MSGTDGIVVAVNGSGGHIKRRKEMIWIESQVTGLHIFRRNMHQRKTVIQRSDITVFAEGGDQQIIDNQIIIIII